MNSKHRHTATRFTVRTLAAGLVLGLGLGSGAFAEETKTAAEGGKKPAILIVRNREWWNPLIIQEMLDAGYEVGISGENPPTDAELSKYNVVLLADYCYSDFAASLKPRLEKFLERGGGILATPAGDVEKPLRHASYFKWLRGLGATITLQGVLDPERKQVIDWCTWPGAPEYIWTGEFADSPIMRGVKTLWYRTGGSANSSVLSAPLELSKDWTPLVFTGPNSRTLSWAQSPAERDTILSTDFRKAYAEFIRPESQAQGRLPLVAVREVGVGRIAMVSLNPQDLFWSGYIPAMGGVMLHRGFGDRPSDGWKLLDNLYRWLAEPSLAGTALGGAKTARAQLFRAPAAAPRPYDWKTGAEEGLGKSISDADPLRAGAMTEAAKLSSGGSLDVPCGLAGAKSAFSSGKGTVAEWVAAAKAAGLDFLLFMEDLDQMNAGKWEMLRAECATLSDDKFLAYPGLEFCHENFNRGYFFNSRWRWLIPEKIFTRDGRFIQTSRNVPSSEAGPLNLWLAYEQPEAGQPLCTSMTVGFFSHRSNLTPTWAQRGFGSMAVMARDGQGVIDDFQDTLPIFLRQQNQKLVISPMGLSLMTDPAEIAGVVKRGGPFVTLLASMKNARYALDHGGTYCYAGRSSTICATTGPRILAWNATHTTPYVFDRWNVPKREEDYFVLDNYRYRVRLAAQSPAGLKEILVYDGDHGVYRRFLPEGKTRYEATLDLSNDQSRHLVLVVKDQAGGVAVSPEIQTEHWANRHYLCADRCNWGRDNLGQGAYYPHPGPHTAQQGPETMLLGRWSRPVISPDLTVLQVNLERRFETAGAYQYPFGNPWHCYYRTWPAEEMKIAKTQYGWRGSFGGGIYYVEEWFPLGLDSIWTFPMPKQPFYPENRWIPDPKTKGQVSWGPRSHTATDVTLTDDVTFRSPWVSALGAAKDYVPGQDGYDFRIGGRQVAGLFPGTNEPPLELRGEAPEGGVFSISGGGGKTTACWFVSGAGLSYKLVADKGKATLSVGWPVADGMAKKGALYRSELCDLSGPSAAGALDELLRPSGLTARCGAPVAGRFPYTYNATDGAVVLKAGDLRPVPCEWIPLEVRGLSPRRTAYWREFGSDNRIRPIGVDPDGVGRATLWRGKHDAEFFLGHPVLCSDPEIWFDAVRMADGSWIVDVNNPTDEARAVSFSWSPGWPGGGEWPKELKLPPGGRVQIAMKEVAQ